MGKLKNCLLSKTRRYGLGVGVLISLIGIADAANLPEHAQVHGFVSQAYITTSDNNFWGETSGNEHFEFRELGLNLSIQPTSDIHLAGQVLARHAGNLDNGDFRLDYILADYSILSNQTQSFGIRIGRILNPLGLYNETRDIAFTRPGILLPQSIYFDRTRDLAFSSDGVQLHGEYRVSNNEVFWQLSTALPIVDSPELELALLQSDMPGGFKPDQSYLGRLLWERDGGRTRLGLSYAYVDIHYDPATVDPLSSGHIAFMPAILSAQYNEEKWSATTEYAIRRFEYRDLGAIPDMSFTGDSWYLQGTYRPTTSWEVFARYDNLFSDKSDRDGKDYEATTSKPAYTRFARDLTFGVKKVFNPWIMVRAEYHNVDGTAWLSTLENQPISSLKRRWDMFALLMSLRF